MREQDLIYDRDKHTIYSDSIKNGIQRLLRLYHDRRTAKQLWHDIQLKWCALTEDAPAFGKVPHNNQFYDSLLIFAYCDTVPELPPRAVLQQEVCDSIMGMFEGLGKTIDVNLPNFNILMGGIFKASVAAKARLAKKYPDSFQPTKCHYDPIKGEVRYSFTKCPVADFALAHGYEKYLPLCCNCDHLALAKVGAGLIREHTCGISDECDYLIVGSKSKLYAQYHTEEDSNGLLISVRNTT